MLGLGAFGLIFLFGIFLTGFGFSNLLSFIYLQAQTYNLYLTFVQDGNDAYLNAGVTQMLKRFCNFLFQHRPKGLPFRKIHVYRS